MRFARLQPTSIIRENLLKNAIQAILTDSHMPPEEVIMHGFGLRHRAGRLPRADHKWRDWWVTVTRYSIMTWEDSLLIVTIRIYK